MLKTLWMGFKLPVDLLSHSWPVASFSGCLSSSGSDLFFVHRLLAPSPFLHICSPIFKIVPIKYNVLNLNVDRV